MCIQEYSGILKLMAYPKDKPSISDRRESNYRQPSDQLITGAVEFRIPICSTMYSHYGCMAQCLVNDLALQSLQLAHQFGCKESNPTDDLS